MSLLPSQFLSSLTVKSVLQKESPDSLVFCDIQDPLSTAMKVRVFLSWLNMSQETGGQQDSGDARVRYLFKGIQRTRWNGIDSTKSLNL